MTPLDWAASLAAALLYVAVATVYHRRAERYRKLARRWKRAAQAAGRELAAQQAEHELQRTHLRTVATDGEKLRQAAMLERDEAIAGRRIAEAALRAIAQPKPASITEAPPAPDERVAGVFAEQSVQRLAAHLASASGRTPAECEDEARQMFAQAEGFALM